MKGECECACGDGGESANKSSSLRKEAVLLPDCLVMAEMRRCGDTGGPWWSMMMEVDSTDAVE